MTDATGTYLDDIVRDVRARLDDAGPQSFVIELESAYPTRRMSNAIGLRRAARELAVIAEVKRRSPSVGAIDLDVDPATQAGIYAAAGAAGISVLTEPDHFGGSVDDLAAVTAAVTVGPAVLRKDFVLERRQVAEAAFHGATTVLLIAALHDKANLRRLREAAESADLEALVEVHDEAELERTLASGATLVGINSRNLVSFEVDLGVVERLAPLVPADVLLVAESGIRTVADAERVRDAGVDAVLIGEALMRADDPAALLRAFAAVGPGEVRGG